eukprot:CCRYP_015657-RA/>CCRYP_015657-RA protein AED:0.43 eAED:0.43 QI:0/-1/0/1/-1/1/1/0/954
MSGIISARERKRQIRERRRQSLQNQPAPTEASAGEMNEASCSTINTNERIDAPNRGLVNDSGYEINRRASKLRRRDHRQEDSNLGRDNGLRSMEYTNGSYSKSSRASMTYMSCENIQSEDAASLLLESDTMKQVARKDQEFASTASSAGPPRSLFSAVMTRSSILSPHCDGSSSDNYRGGEPLSNGESLLGNELQSTTHERDENVSESDPKPTATNVTFSAGTSTPVKSPMKRPLLNKANSPGRSPGGYEIMRTLDGVSDFTQTFYNMRNDENENEEEQHEIGLEDSGYRTARIFTRSVPLTSTFAARHTTNGYHEPFTIHREAENADSNPLNTIIEETKLATDSNSMNSAFYQEPVGIGLMDWSLKKRVRILCSSGSLPGTAMSSCSRDRNRWHVPDDGIVHQLGIQYLTNSYSTNFLEECYGRPPSLEESAIAKWLAATMYYQHPAIHPLPSSVLLKKRNGNNQSTDHSEGGQTTINLSSFNNRSSYERVRLTGIGSMGGLGKSERVHKSKFTRDQNMDTNPSKSASSSLVASFPKLLDRRISEWQEAFRSMHQLWRSKMKLLRARYFVTQKSDSISSLTRTKTGPPSPDEVSRCSFYSVSPSQVILFRVGLDKENNLFPVVVFSSTTAEFRSKVKSMGASLKLFKRSNKLTSASAINEPEEEFVEDMPGNTNAKATAEITDRDAAADLRALREANNSSSDNRPTEVSVTQTRKAQGDNFSKASTLPLYVSGDDDCDIVYEILLNTCGFSISGSYGSWHFHHDVPLLLCRSLGPCLNTVLRTLSVSARRDNVYWNQLAEEGSENQNAESVMELYGPILPCALRDLMCASVNWMVLDQHFRNVLEEFNVFDVPTQPIDSENTSVSKTNIDYQVSMLLQAHEGEAPITSPSSTGTASSSFFNGSNISISHEQNNQSNNSELPEWRECDAGEGLNSLIWDTSRSKTELDYNTFLT